VCLCKKVRVYGQLIEREFESKGKASETEIAKVWKFEIFLISKRDRLENQDRRGGYHLMCG